MLNFKWELEWSLPRAKTMTWIGRWVHTLVCEIRSKVNACTSGWTGASFLEQFKQKNINCRKIGCSVGTSKPLINLFSNLSHLITNIAWKKNLSHCVVLGFTVGWRILMIWLRNTSSLLREFRCCYHQF